MVFCRPPELRYPDAEIVADMEVRAQRGILWRQKEGLRHSLDPIGTRASPDWWRAQIAETETRLADAEADLARARGRMGEG